VIKYLLIILAISNTHAATASKTTVYSLCTDSSKNPPLSIVVAMETLSQNSCKGLGQKKAEQYVKAGWKCVGKNNEDLYSCENERAASFAIYNNIKLDHLTFTNLQKHRSLVAYINPNSNKICHEDQAELISAGVKDAVCHKRAP
jgi:hypothetical protein